MSKGKAPAPPDPQETAAAQTGQNVGTAVANTVMGQVNQVGPDGSLTYEQTGSYNWRDPNSGRMYNLPQYTATTTLSEDAQNLRDANNRGNLALANLGADQAERVGDLLGGPFDPASISPQRADRSGISTVKYGADLNAPTLGQDGRALPNQVDSYAGADDFGAQRDQIVDGLMGQLNEQRDRDYESLRTQLYNQGVREGSEAYSRAMEDFDRSVDDRRLSAILAGGQEQSRLVGMARDAAGFGNDARLRSHQLGSDQLAFNNAVRQQDFGNRQAIQGRRDSIGTNTFNQQRALADDQDRARAGALDEAYAARANPINEISALLSGSQIATPNFSMAQPSPMPTTDIAGITQQGYANQMAAYNAQQQSRNAMMGGLFGLGGAALAGGVGPSWLYASGGG